jgi:ABC-type phosphate transport system substrate-binding protein
VKRFAGACVLALLAGGRPLGAAGDSGVALVVNATNSVSELSSDEVARLFLKKVRTWPDGRMAAPVDQSSTSPVRAQFGKEILRLTLGQQKEYWMAQTLSGRELPPRALEGDAAVLDFVGTQTGAIAYVSARTELPPTVKALKVVVP